MKYRKRPVVIDAIQYVGSNLSELLDWMDQYSVDYNVINDRLFIVTLEGDMEVSLWDYVIKGVKNEFYPCKPDIFMTTYEAV